MKIAYKHLLRSLLDKPDINDLSNKLFQLGHEHEIEKSIFDMEFTPNRGDCLSLQGLTRDLNVFYETDLKIPIYLEDIPLLDLNFINSAQDKCPQISFLNIVIKGEVSKYKPYLEEYFKDLKINKNNFFTDISNYVAYELGQPTHAYEFSSIGDDITLQESTTNFKFKTLLGESIKLEGSDLVFTSEEEIINLSGIIGGINTACSSKTKNALIECAYFKPDAIIGKAVKYNIHSDASHKFERGTDPKCHEKVLRRFIQIVSEHVEIIKLELYSCNTPFKETELSFDFNKVNKILGTNITEDVYKDSIIKLGFEVNNVIRVPSYRSDVSHQNDLAEELARVIGYDNLPVSSINLKELSYESNLSDELMLKRFLIDKGFVEVINSPFCSTNHLDTIKVDNPLDSNREFLRTNIIDSLVENLIYNEKRQKDSIKFFEISDIYTSSNDVYTKKLALIVSGRRGLNYLDFSRKLDNKYLIELFKEIGIDINKHIKNIDRSKLSSKIKTPIFALELTIDNIVKNISNYVPLSQPPSNFVKYESISEFPSSFRDLSFSVKDSSKIEEVIKILSNSESALLKHSFMFDLYKNKKTGESKIGFRFIFQSSSRTLTDIEIDQVISTIISPILSINSVSLPGVM